MESVQKFSHTGISFVLSSTPSPNSLNKALEEQLIPELLTRGQEREKKICFKGSVVNHISCQLLQCIKSPKVMSIFCRDGFNNQEWAQKTQLEGPAALTKGKPQCYTYHPNSPLGQQIRVSLFCFTQNLMKSQIETKAIDFTASL